MQIHHICIQTQDYNASKEFYTRLLGFTLVQESTDFHTRDFNTWLSLDGFMIELQTAKTGIPLSAYNKDSEGIVHFCLYSEDFDQDYGRIKEDGCVNFRQKQGSDIYEVENGRLFKIIAPEGTIVEVRDQNTL